MIIEEINRRILIKMRADNLPESVIQNSLIIKDGNINMCQLAIHVAFSVNGVASLHTNILKKKLLKIYIINIQKSLIIRQME